MLNVTIRMRDGTERTGTIKPMRAFPRTLRWKEGSDYQPVERIFARTGDQLNGDSYVEETPEEVTLNPIPEAT